MGNDAYRYYVSQVDGEYYDAKVIYWQNKDFCSTILSWENALTLCII